MTGDTDGQTEREPEVDERAPLRQAGVSLLHESFARLAECARVVGGATRAFVILDGERPLVVSAAGEPRARPSQEGATAAIVGTTLRVQRAILRNAPEEPPGAVSVLCAPLVDELGAHAVIYLERDAPFEPGSLPRIEALAGHAAGTLAVTRLCTMLREIGDHSPAFLCVKDADGRYLFTNRRFNESFQRSGDELLGKSDHDLFPHDRADSYRASDLRVLATNAPLELRYVEPREDGPIEFEVLKFPLRDAAGRAWAVGAIAYDVTDRCRAQDAQRHSLSLLEAALESTADGLLVVDRRGQVARFNRRFAALWRIPDEVLASGDDAAALRHVVDQLVDPDDFLRKVQDLYAHPEASSFDQLRFRDGRVFERYSQPQRLGGEVVGRVWSFRDVTARVRAEQERDRLLTEERRARADAEAAVHLRDEFLSVASHELRTPLMSLQLAVRLIRDRFAPEHAPDLRHVTEIAERQVRRLGQLVRLLLDVTRLQNGQLELVPAETDLAAVVRDAVSLLADDIARSGSTLRVRADQPVVGRWDALRLEQAVTNLLSNASKFGLGRPIDVEVARDGEHAAVTVHDRGLGIPAEVRERLGRPFQRGVSPRHYGGLGLGLFITRSIVEAHGGRLRVFSEPGQGSTFTIELPLAGVRK